MNVLMIIADQINTRHLGFNKKRIVRTPNIDALAADAVVFDKAYCQAPQCMPSRASFNTGLYTESCQVRHNPDELQPQYPTIAEHFRKNGWNTGGFGHIGGDGCERGYNVKIDLIDSPIKDAWAKEQIYLLSDGPKPAWHAERFPFPIEDNLDYNTFLLQTDF